MARAATLLACLYHFLQASPFGQTPAVTFDAIGVPPHFVHTIVGDKVWVGFWGDRSQNIAGSNWIPTTMVPILRHIAERKAADHANHKMAAAPSRKRWETAKAAAAERKKRGSPY